MIATRRIAVFILLGVSIGYLGQAGLVHGKAWLGQLLLERAWARTIDGEQAVEPWPGAVSHPVARLHVERLNLDYLVLDGVDTPVLAWGPGMETGFGGHRLIAAHRDTHFRFLEALEIGDRLVLRHADGGLERWRVNAIDVVDGRITALDMGLRGSNLTLVTCYPFDAVTAGGPLRYVVSLDPDHSEDRS